MVEKKLVDPQERHIHKLRLGLLDACNFRCPYCMPNNPQFLNSKDLISKEEIKNITKNLVSLGIDEVRVTGGEPTLRPEFMEIVQDLSELPLRKLGLTSNGFNLFKYLPSLKKTNCEYINLSLDSLTKAGFFAMTRTDQLENVLRSLFMAQELGFKIKVNCVVMKGINDHEILNFIDFAYQHDIEVRFLELMRIGEARSNFEKHFISIHEILQAIEKKYSFKEIKVAIDSTSKVYQLDNGTKFGVIASESIPFCGGCSRLRLSPTGDLRPCLMKNEGFNLRNKDIQETEEILYRVMKLKPIDRIYEVQQQMNQIGG